MDDIRRKVGDRIKEFRSKAGLTQLQVADRAGLNLCWFGQVERGQRTATILTLERICRALNVTLGEFFKGSHNGSFQQNDLLIRELTEILRGKKREDIRFVIDIAGRILQSKQPIKRSKRR